MPERAWLLRRGPRGAYGLPKGHSDHSHKLLEAVEQRLPRAGVKGVTVTHVKGYGEYADFFSHDWHVRHVRLEMFTEGALVTSGEL